MKPRLGVNIDHVATLRQARRTIYPDPLEATTLAIRGGADQITVHLREDRRHIQDTDVERLKASIGVPLNLEMAAVDEITAIACRIKPATATLVPERREELTTEGGLAVAGNADLSRCVDKLKEEGIAVSFFIGPDTREVHASKEMGADAVELHTGTYCEAANTQTSDGELKRLREAAAHAASLNLKVAAGHGLHYDNVRKVIEVIPHIEEYNIGHSIVARAMFVGMEDAVREMKILLT
jgi:pyridoxine 5-phosphate synthase